MVDNKAKVNKKAEPVDTDKDLNESQKAHLDKMAKADE